MDKKALLERESPFSYVCNQCSRCCYNKVIRLNPYEVARLADHLGIKSSEFIREYTEANGTVLKRVKTGACVFLTPKGCGVHSNRPLVCRLYPLGRHLSADGKERFSESTPHPQSAGVYGKEKTVSDYLEAQGTAPFIGAVDRYLDLLKRMAIALQRNTRKNGLKRQQVRKAALPFVKVSDDAPEWLDIDPVVSDYCEKNGLTPPKDPSEKMEIHIRAVEAWLQTL